MTERQRLKAIHARAMEKWAEPAHMFRAWLNRGGPKCAHPSARFARLDAARKAARA